MRTTPVVGTLVTALLTAGTLATVAAGPASAAAPTLKPAVASATAAPAHLDGGGCTSVGYYWYFDPIRGWLPVAFPDSYRGCLDPYGPFGRAGFYNGFYNGFGFDNRGFR